MNDIHGLDDLPADTQQSLVEIARQYGTPTYAFDIRRIRAQVEKLRRSLPDEIELLYSLKANASLGIADLMQQSGLGAEVASAGELATAMEAGFSDDQLFVTGPCKSAETLQMLEDLPRAIISVDSPAELELLAKREVPQPIVLRLRPDFGSCAVVAAGSESRFGFADEDVQGATEWVKMAGLEIAGFHIFSGSQMLDTESLVGQLARAMDLAIKTAARLEVQPLMINLGGGFGIPYGPRDEEIDLAAVGAELARQLERARPARVIVELGRYLVAQSGWYLTSVLDEQTWQGRRAIVVDGGTHQRDDMCGLELSRKAHPPILLESGSRECQATDILGCLSLPSDVLACGAMIPLATRGQVLAFANAGAYGVWSSPAAFHASVLPAEVAFDGTGIQPMRERMPAHSVLDGQRHVALKSLTTPSQ